MSAITILQAEVGAKISGDTNSKSFNLLYSASQNIDVEEFHVKCDSKGPTVTLLHGKYNTLFGGYPSKNWTSTERQTKEDANAFLFYKDKTQWAKCEFLPVKKCKKHKAITCDALFCPTFGGVSKKKYDLQVLIKDKNAQSKHSSERDVEKSDKTLKKQITDIRGIKERSGLDREFDHLLNGELPEGYK
ncbi:uncharacterized protein LOC128554931, partial [Mercenaria mercenaria]|uniref:uncharacterized protein LOC128554931 n=1 Tax=Mercenaria mercenaria TaxID=6596 RepID=UPI00234E6DA5